jgi:sulfiredoxin
VSSANAILSLDHDEARDLRNSRHLRADKRRTTLEQNRVGEIAGSMLDEGQRTPILVRADAVRFVLVEGLHRLEAAKALGEKTIIGFLVSARKHRMAWCCVRAGPSTVMAE